MGIALSRPRAPLFGDKTAKWSASEQEQPGVLYASGGFRTPVKSETWTVRLQATGSVIESNVY